MMMIPASTSCTRLSQRIQRSVLAASVMRSPRHRATQAIEGKNGAEHDRGQRQHESTGVTDVEELEANAKTVDVQRVGSVAGAALGGDVDDVEEAQKIDAAQDGRGDDRRQQQGQRDALERLERRRTVDLRRL